ncbi:MAG: hypothetical protein MUE33_05490 [Cytophagaceae bacterium]|jgi:hypothetical protein|nr:hypothetical protein [Cytophagaceae bacterium]
MRSILFILSLSVCTLKSFGQIETPPRKHFTTGIFIGYGGASYVPIPALDIRYRGTTLRIAPGIRYQGIGLSQELFPISKSFYNCYTLISLHYIKGDKDVHNGVVTEFDSYSALAGLKYYVGGRFTTELQLGVNKTINTTPGFEDKDPVSPSFLFGFGIYLFRNFDKPILDE